MNERIRELAEQAGYSKDYLAIGLPNNMEKFAELIAYKCIDLALGSSHREDDMGAIIANKIKQHFGVQE
jgi:hypothetical protein